MKSNSGVVIRRRGYKAMVVKPQMPTYTSKEGGSPSCEHLLGFFAATLSLTSNFLLFAPSS